MKVVANQLPASFILIEKNHKMMPDKRKTVKGHKVEQYYLWLGEDVVYVDNRLADEKYDEITAENIDELIRQL